MKTFKEFRKQELVAKLKKLKGITKDQVAALSSMNPATLQTVINQLSTLVNGKTVDERAALVANIPTVIKVMLKDIQKKLETEQI